MCFKHHPSMRADERQASMGNVLRKAGTGTAAYDEDFYLWSRMQAERLRALKLRPADLDIENIATEIEDLGKRDFRSLQSHCATAIEHLLKLAWSIRDEQIGRASCRERVCQSV